MATETLEKPAAEVLAIVTRPDEQQLKREADAFQEIQKRLQREAQAFLSMVDSFVIDGQDTLQDAADERNRIMDRWNVNEAARKYLKAPSIESGKRIDRLYQPILDTLDVARKKMDAKITGFQEQQRKALEDAERKAREEAERDAARKRELAAKEEAESKAKAEALRKQAEELAAAGNAGRAAQLQERAASVETNGQQKAAELQIQAEQTAAMPLPVAATTTKASGIATQYDYSAEVFNTLALLQHIVEKRPDLIALVEIKASALNGQAKSLKEALDLPGVKLIKKSRVSDRR